MKQGKKVDDDPAKWDLNDPYLRMAPALLQILAAAAQVYQSQLPLQQLSPHDSQFTMWFVAPASWATFTKMKIELLALSRDLSKGSTESVTSNASGVIANFLALAHACESSMHVRDYWGTPSFWLAPEQGTMFQALQEAREAGVPARKQRRTTSFPQFQKAGATRALER